MKIRNKMNFQSNIIYIYCDGACRNNQSLDKSFTLGAFGYIIHLNGKEKEFAQAEKETTSNRQELYGLINALSILEIKNLPILIYPDSDYLLKGATIWIKNWKRNNWKTSAGEDVKNQDLWKWLDELMNEFNDIKFIKVKGHSNDEYNNKVDALCNKAMDDFENRTNNLKL